MKKQIIYFATKLALFLFLIYIILFVIYGITRLENNNMFPSLKDGDLLLYYRLNNKYEKGDVVAYRYKGKLQIARIIATPNDSVVINDEKELLINGDKEETTVFYETEESTAINYPYIINANKYFVLNDYRSDTNDSRTFGAISKKNIVGKVIFRMQSRNL